MTPEIFDELVCKQFERCMAVLYSKKDEYSEGRDRLDQFKKAALYTGKHPKEVLGGMMIKHTTSIYDLIAKESSGGQVGLGMWEEKITDHINYLVLLMGLVCETE